jgi:hypothetical protein
MDALAVTKDKFNAALQCLPDETRQAGPGAARPALRQDPPFRGAAI